MMETDQGQNGSGDSKNLTNLIINYLPQDLTDEEFKEIFVACGTVLSAKIIRDRATNYSHGYGFVEYSSPEEAQAAIEGLNGLPLQHKTIKVALARPPGGQSKNANLYIQGIPSTFNNDALQEIFAPYGEIVHAKVLVKADMSAKGDGFVLFKTEDSAQSALNDLNGQTLPGGSKPMSIKYAMENKRQNQNQGQQGGPGGKYPPPPPAPGGRGGRGGGAGGGFGGPMRTRGGQQQNRFNPMQQRGGRGAGGFAGARGAGRGAGGGWRGGQNNGNGFGGGDEGFYGADQGAYGGDGGFGGGYGGDGGFGGDGSFGGAGGFGAQGGYDQTGFGGAGGFGGGEEYYDESQGQGGFQEYPENGYQGYYDAVGFQGYQMPGQQRGRGARGGGVRGAPRGAPGGGRGGPRGGRGGPGAPRGRGRGGAGGGGNYSAPATGIALYVYNIGPNATDDDVMTIFSHYGSVTKVDVIMDYEKNVTKNYAFVHMSTEEEAETAISALNERYCMRPNHPMQVRYHQPKQKKQLE